MKSAGETFTTFALKPAEHPTVFRFGKKALYDMDMQHYKGFRRSYWGNVLHVSEALGPTTYRYGVRLEFDPASEKAIEIIGPYVHDRAFQDFIIKPTDQITYNWQTGYLQLDSPSAKTIVGFLPERWDFSDGVKLENIHVQHPKGQVYVIPGERYVAVSVVAADGLPLDKSAEVTITALSTSFNSGLKVAEGLIKPMSSENPMAGLAWGAKFKQLFDYGSEVTTSRVGVTVKAEFLKGRKFEFYDWNLSVIKSGIVEKDEFELPAELPITFAELYTNR